MGKTTSKQQLMTLLREHPVRDTLITHLVKLDATGQDDGRPDAFALASSDQSAGAPFVSPIPPDAEDSPLPSRTEDADARLLQECLSGAYVFHALAGLLPGRRNAFARRTFDLALGLLLAALILPLIAVLALAVRLGLAKEDRAPGEPIFIRRRYIGRGGRFFMGVNIRALRATRLRRLSALPLILNVVHGEMSLVGPRPMLYTTLMESDVFSSMPLSLAASQSLARYSLKPGFTGPWLIQRHALRSQTDGAPLTTQPLEHADLIDCVRNDDPDLMYVARSSLGRDLVILLRAPLFLFAR